MAALPPRFKELADWLVDQTGADALAIDSMHKMAGGAIQENWQLHVTVRGGTLDGASRLVLRTDAPSSVGESHGRAEEFALLQAAFTAGVAVATPHLLSSGRDVIGTPFFIMDHRPGQAQARKIVRDPALPDYEDALAAALGREMARIHSIGTSDGSLSFLPLSGDNAAEAQIADSRAALDALDSGQPVTEYALNWLEDRLDEWRCDRPRVLCHRDFRTGNYLVDKGRLTAVLDWEFAGWSDPAEDIGWLCARCWRFGNDARTVGGIAGFEAFRKAYEAETGTVIDLRAVMYWQVIAETRWATISRQQEQRALSGGETSLELALSGYLTAEMERNMLALITEIEAGAAEGPL